MKDHAVARAELVAAEDALREAQAATTAAFEAESRASEDAWQAVQAEKRAREDVARAREALAFHEDELPFNRGGEMPPAAVPREGDVVERPCARCGRPVQMWWTSSAGEYPVYHGDCLDGLAKRTS